MIYIQTENNVLDKTTSIAYSVKTSYGKNGPLEKTDFFELILVISGDLSLSLSGKEWRLSVGNMILIRPGDVHLETGEGSTYVTLAFSKKIFESLISYLEWEEEFEQFLNLPYIEPVLLKHQELLYVRERMETIGSMTSQEGKKVRTSFKVFLHEIFSKYYMKDISAEMGNYERIPKWLVQALGAWQLPENRQKGLEFFCQYTGFSKEHICRSFKTHLKMSPTAYLNKQRLKHAVALMKETNESVLDIAFEAGFKSTSRFYQVFKEVYGMSPRDFCSLGKRQMKE